MENKENIQMPEINEVETVNVNETVAAGSNQESFQEQEPVVKRRRLNLGGPVEQISMTVMAIGLAAVMLISSQWAKYVIAGICALAFFVPIVIRAARKSGGINAEKVCSILKKRGFSPVVNGDEIRWTSNGKECILRVRSRC